MVYIWQESWCHEVMAKNKADFVHLRIDIAAQYEYNMKYSVLLDHNE